MRHWATLGCVVRYLEQGRLMPPVPLMAAGGWLATPNGLLKFLAALRSNALLDPPTTQMVQPAIGLVLGQQSLRGLLPRAVAASTTPTQPRQDQRRSTQTSASLPGWLRRRAVRQFRDRPTKQGQRVGPHRQSVRSAAAEDRLSGRAVERHFRSRCTSLAEIISPPSHL